MAHTLIFECLSYINSFRKPERKKHVPNTFRVGQTVGRPPPKKNIDVIIVIFKLFARLTLTPIIRKPCHPLRSQGIESDIFFDNSSGILCGILSGILPGIYSDNVL